jgi:hypothetical protein
LETLGAWWLVQRSEALGNPQQDTAHAPCRNRFDHA